ncbi:hypothetical protein [Litorivita sp. NS0012-18]
MKPLWLAALTVALLLAGTVAILIAEQLFARQTGALSAPPHIATSEFM